MLVLCYDKCTTCQKALWWLEVNGIEYELRDIKADNPDYEELRAWYEISGLDIKRFFNTSGLLYKSMKLKEKLDNMTVEEKLQLLSSDGMLVKRPLVIHNKIVLTGFKENEWNKLK